MANYCSTTSNNSYTTTGPHYGSNSSTKKLKITLLILIMMPASQPKKWPPFTIVWVKKPAVIKHNPELSKNEISPIVWVKKPGQLGWVKKPDQLKPPTVIKHIPEFSKNEISPNPNLIRTTDVEVGTHGTISHACDRYFWALTSPLFKAQLFFIDAFYAVGIIKHMNSTVAYQSLRNLHAECKPRPGWTWFNCRSDHSLCLPKGSFALPDNEE
jgi:hypothetical protein